MALERGEALPSAMWRMMGFELADFEDKADVVRALRQAVYDMHSLYLADLTDKSQCFKENAMALLVERAVSEMDDKGNLAIAKGTDQFYVTGALIKCPPHLRFLGDARVPVREFLLMVSERLKRSH